ncbi:MAG: helix-turn-helix transcriptional regulator [Oscillospiraceae bacterium]|nr:helix-turn-helix transcriptional regulator [Oscillospiraceae bacterium]
MENLKLHDTISFYRKQQNLTQEALAQKLGVTNQSVSKWESAQCYPDISLIPQLADIFGISIDELFGKEPCISGLKDVFSLRDDVIRVVVARGQQIIDIKEINEQILLEIPKREDGQRTRVEVFGNINCKDSIFGDVECQGSIQCSKDIFGNVSSSGNIDCNTIYGDASNFYGTLSCKGDIHGNASTFQGGTISCSNILGNVVHCQGSVTCEKIEGNVEECQGNIIYK